MQEDPLRLFRTVVLAAGVAACLGTASGGERNLMHCFAWTAVKEATSADWDAFFKASDALPQEIKGVQKVWYGKMDAPLGTVRIVKMDDENRKRARAGEPATGEVIREPRDHAMCMEITDAAALKAYAVHPYHKVWEKAYSKIRIDGTTTFNILGQ